jgi:hypothetical protein
MIANTEQIFRPLPGTTGASRLPEQKSAPQVQSFLDA